MTLASAEAPISQRGFSPAKDSFTVAAFARVRVCRPRRKTMGRQRTPAACARIYTMHSIFSGGAGSHSNCFQQVKWRTGRNDACEPEVLLGEQCFVLAHCALLPASHDEHV